MAVTVIFLVVSLVSVSYCSPVGLSCMQKDVVQRKVLECFSGLDDGSLDRLNFGDGNLASMGDMLSETTCGKESLIVKGLDCFYNFYGDCLNIRPLLPSVHNIETAIKDACDNIKYFQNPCLKTMAADMTKCSVQKIQERQMNILTRKAKFVSQEDEVCRGYTEELKCLKNGPPTCPSATSQAFYTFVNDLVPYKCKYPNLMHVLKDNTQVRGLALTRMDNGPR